MTVDQRLRWSMTAALVATTLLAAAAYLAPNTSSFAHWFAIAHFLTGIVFAGLIGVYLVVHFRRVVGVRRPGLVLSGLAGTVVAIGLVFTGGFLGTSGNTSANAAVYLAHVACGLVFVGLVVLHLVQHIVGLPERRRTSTGIHSFAALRRRLLLPSAAVGLTGLAAFGLVAAFTESSPSAHFSSSPTVGTYDYSAYGEHPFRPSQTETANGDFVKPESLGNSASCGSCHETIVRQWQSSAHRYAAADPAYVTNINLLEHNKGIAATRYCEGCHAPVALLAGQLTEGGEHGGTPGTTAFDEGVSCMTCHGIDQVVHTKGVASYRYAGRSRYPGETLGESFGFLTELAIMLKPELHREELNRELHERSSFCATCHSQFMDESMNGWGWVRMQDEFGAWQASHYAGTTQADHAVETVTGCRDCHMPLTEAPEDPAADDGMVRSHHFAAANTMLALAFDEQEQLERIRRFLKQAKMHITIDAPQERDSEQSRFALDERVRDRVNTPWYYYLGESVDVNVVVTNTGVGHDFPGGTIDINEAWISFEVFDAQGRAIYTSGSLDADLYVDPDAVFYRSIPVNRWGKEVWRHDLFNMVGETYRRVVKAGASDVVTYGFEIPGWAQSPLQMTATLKYRKLNRRYSTWALAHTPMDIPVIDMARATETVPLRIEPSAGELLNVRAGSSLERR